jgi:hypothetical protein
MPAATPTAGIVAEGTNPILGLNPGGEAPTEPALKSTVPDQNQTSSQTFFPYLQIGLALFAAAAALAAFLIRRSMR